MTDTGMRGGFTPTVLIVDDDHLVTRRWSREFLSQTSLGVVVANSLSQAADLIEAGEVNIDAVVADLFFGYDTTDDIRNLQDGLQFLDWTQKQGLSVPLFVISANAEMVDYKKRSEELKLRIVEFFDKFDFHGSGESIWMRIQRAILEKKIGGGGLVALEEGEAADPASAEALNRILSRLQLAVRTYLQELPRAPFYIHQPIEVICVAQTDGSVKAYAPSLALLTVGQGESVREALEDLSDVIETEAETLLSPESGALSEYATIMRERFERHIAPAARKDDRGAVQ